MSPLRYDVIYELACERKGGPAAVDGLLPQPLSRSNIAALPSDRFLAEFTRKVFQSGFVWRVVNQKWGNFEESFWGFDVQRLLMMPDDMLERKAKDPGIIRNLNKVTTVRHNAMMIADAERRENKGFGQFVADWPTDDIVALWQYLKKHGSRLGGNTGPYALRTLGVDTFLLTQDVEGFLRNRGVIEGGIASKKSLLAAQHFFNELQQQSGRPLSALSRIVSVSYGQNYVGIEQ